MCWDVDRETNEGGCASLCEGTPDAPTCADPNAACTVANEGTLNLCLFTCDPEGDDCHEGQSWFEEGMAPPGFEDVGACIVPA